jgi:hypothetical protein
LGKDGSLENGSWTKSAPGLRGRGQISVVEAFRVKKIGVEDTATEKARAKVMVDGAREQELDLFGTPSAQPVREASSQVQEQASSYEDEFLRENSSPDEQAQETQRLSMFMSFRTVFELRLPARLVDTLYIRS